MFSSLIFACLLLFSTNAQQGFDMTDEDHQMYLEWHEAMARRWTEPALESAWKACKNGLPNGLFVCVSGGVIAAIADCVEIWMTNSDGKNGQIYWNGNLYPPIEVPKKEDKRWSAVKKFKYIAPRSH